VAMRARKPCVRARRVLWGWNVRFIVGPFGTLRFSGRAKKAQVRLLVKTAKRPGSRLVRLA
jgi:hypothetical protein